MLLMQRRRLDCPNCGPTVERLEWLGRFRSGDATIGRSGGSVMRGATGQAGCEVLPAGVADGEGDPQVMVAEYVGAGGSFRAADNRDG